MFLRKKTVNGNQYWYLVENQRVDGKVRQKVIKYIGSDEKLQDFLEGARK